MKERPIIFSGEMVRAILEDRKTQTRRVVKNPGRLDGRMLEGEEPDWCPYGKPGDRLWVRETFYCDDYRYSSKAVGSERETMLQMMDYRASHDCSSYETGCPCRDESGHSSWRPSIHMPRWASRITLEVTDVRVERVQDIGVDDAEAEGCSGDTLAHPVLAFSKLWDSINGRRPGCSWDANPWVWVIGFRRLGAA